MSFVAARPRARHRRPTPVNRVGKAALVTTAAGALVAGVAPATANAAVPASSASVGATGVEARAASQRPHLRLGSQGAAVRYVQKRVNARATGYYSVTTRRAVMRYQRAKGIAVTGIVETRTWNALGVRRAKAPAVRPAARGGVSSSAVLRQAAALRGVPYRYGGTTPKGFDCSGFTRYVYAKVGKSLPRTSSAQRAATKQIPRSAARPGDLMFWHSGGRITHVGIYAGGNTFWSPHRSGKSVSPAKIWGSSITFGRV